MRRYRLDKHGNEQPIWLSQRKTRDLGTREGEEAARDRRQPIRWGNPAYDEAAKLAFALKSKEMEKGRKLTDREIDDIHRGVEASKLTR